MVFKKLIFSVCSSIFGLKPGRWRIKGPPPLCELIKSTDNATLDKLKEGPLQLDHHDQAFDEGKRCCICLSRLEEGEEDTRLLPCLHEFHRECIDRWLIGCRRTCPLCRRLLEDDEKTENRGDVLTEEMIMWFSSFHVAGF